MPVQGTAVLINYDHLFRIRPNCNVEFGIAQSAHGYWRQSPLEPPPTGDFLRGNTDPYERSSFKTPPIVLPP